MTYYTNWQIAQMGCECLIHRYDVAHICECGALFSHSQAECEEHREHTFINFDPFQYKHGDTAKEVFDRLICRGELPIGTEAYEKVYLHFAE